MKVYTKREAIKIIVTCAERYKDELENKTLLFVSRNKDNDIFCFEFLFLNHHYMHLTGVKPPKNGNGSLASKDFYRKCLMHKLSENDFDFADDGTTHMKLNVLPSVVCKNLSAAMIGDYNQSKPRLYTEKLVGGVHACVGFKAVAGKYIPNTLIADDIRNNSSETLRIIAVCRKDKNDNKYYEITYRATGVNWNDIHLPDEYSYLNLQ